MNVHGEDDEFHVRDVSVLERPQLVLVLSLQASWHHFILGCELALNCFGKGINSFGYRLCGQECDTAGGQSDSAAVITTREPRGSELPQRYERLRVTHYSLPSFA